MIEYGFLSAGYRILRDIWGWVRGRKRRLSPSEIVQLRQKWKTEFEQKLLERRRAGLRTDVIVRDMRRIDRYPNTDDKGKGISPWFRVGLMGTYHKGILLGLRWETLTLDKDKNRWRFTNYSVGEKGEVKVILMGYVPYESIETVNWDGDEYYGFPHIYCYFDARRKEPYESLEFCEQKYLDEYPFYTKVAEYDNVRKFSKRFKIEDFG